MDLKRVEELLTAARWIFAKTMAENPHHYTLRRDWVDEDFVSVVQFIRDVGVVEMYPLAPRIVISAQGKLIGKVKPKTIRPRPYTMLYLGDYKYWTMGCPIDLNGRPFTILINRKITSEERARLRYQELVELKMTGKLMGTDAAELDALLRKENQR